MTQSKSPWRRLKAELNREAQLPYSVQDEFASLKEKSFDFLMNLIEQRDGTPRQLRNALLMASRMRGWGRERFARAVPGFCTHEDPNLRSTVLRILVVWLDQARDIPGERVEGLTAHSCEDAINRALALGVDENTELLARDYLSRRH